MCTVAAPACLCCKWLVLSRKKQQSERAACVVGRQSSMDAVAVRDMIGIELVAMKAARDIHLAAPAQQQWPGSCIAAASVCKHSICRVNSAC